MEEHLLMVADCEKRESKLSDWERTFIASVDEQLSRGEALTESQGVKLDEIWERVT